MWWFVGAALAAECRWSPPAEVSTRAGAVVIGPEALPVAGEAGQELRAAFELCGWAEESEDVRRWRARRNAVTGTAIAAGSVTALMGALVAWGLSDGQAMPPEPVAIVAVSWVPVVVFAGSEARWRRETRHDVSTRLAP